MSLKRGLFSLFEFIINDINITLCINMIILEIKRNIYINYEIN